MKKYTYYKVIQEYVADEWHDSDFYEANASFRFDQQGRKQFREGVKAYRENSPLPIRVINRRELNQ